MTLTWVTSGGGPLLAAPASQLAQWGGVSDGDGPVETWGDYGRACAIEGYIGLVSVGAGQGLVLGDEPATTTYLPDERLFLRWAAASSEAELVAAAGRAVHHARWDEELIWDVDGPVVLFDSTCSGSAVEPDNHLVIDLTPGAYRVNAAYEKGDRNWMILVRLRPTAQSADRPS